MQEKSQRRSNLDRSRSTQASLLDAARTLFVEKGYGDTATPDIVKTAGVTRGALYHHFADKLDLFRAVIDREAGDVADAIARDASAGSDPTDQLRTGAKAYFKAMAVPGRARLLLIDGPATLGPEAMADINKRQGDNELRVGLGAAMKQGAIDDAQLDALAVILAAAFDRAALAIAAGEDAHEYEQAVSRLLEGLTAR